MSERKRGPKPREINNRLRDELQSGRSITFPIDLDERELFEEAGRKSGFEVRRLNLRESPTFPMRSAAEGDPTKIIVAEWRRRSDEEVIVVTKPATKDHHSDFWQAVADESRANPRRRRGQQRG